MPVIISTNDLERIRSKVQEPIQTDLESKRQELKKISTIRTQKWPNTLEAMRKKKENWKKEMEEKKEERRKEIDKEEMELQKEIRLAQIERANKLIYEETDKIKTLRSKQLLVDVINDRKNQINEKNILLKNDKIIQSRWDSVLHDELIEANNKKIKEDQIKQDKLIKLANDQKIQLEEYKQKYINQLREEKKEGQMIHIKAILDMKEEEEKEQEKKRKAKQANEEAKLANEKLKELKRKEKDKELIEEEKRKNDEKKKEEIIEKRNELQRKKNERLQNHKNRMIQLATDNLIKCEKKNEEILQNQKREVQEREDKELAYRAGRRALETEMIHKSRQNQLAKKLEIKQKELENAKILTKEWAEHNQKVGKAEIDEREALKVDNKELAKYQVIQADARKKAIMNEKENELLTDKMSKNIIMDENKRYLQVVKSVIIEAKENGVENMYPLKVALTATNIDLLPAGGFRV